MSQLLDLDERRRTTLSKVGHHRRYLAEELADGTVVLHPAVVMTEVQARLLSAPDLLFALTQANSLETERPCPADRRRSAGAPRSFAALSLVPAARRHCLTLR